MKNLPDDAYFPEESGNEDSPAGASGSTSGPLSAHTVSVSAATAKSGGTPTNATRTTDSSRPRDSVSAHFHLPRTVPRKRGRDNRNNLSVSRHSSMERVSRSKKRRFGKRYNSYSEK